MAESNAVEELKEETTAQAAVEVCLPYRLVLDFSAIEMTGDQFVRFCAENGDLRFELTAAKELIVMPPEGLGTSQRNGKLYQRLANWADQDGSGLPFGPSAGFTLPNGAVRGPDASWLLAARWDGLEEDEQEGFGHICPDFVVELRSPSDKLPHVQAKMVEYIDNGVRLGWLIDPFNRTVDVYRPDQEVEHLEQPSTVAGAPVLPGFELDLAEIW